MTRKSKVAAEKITALRVSGYPGPILPGNVPDIRKWLAAGLNRPDTPDEVT